MELQINKWYIYKDKSGDTIGLICCTDTTSRKGYGFWRNTWANKLNCRDPQDGYFRKEATDEEVKEALINEAKKRYGTNTAICLHKCEPLHNVSGTPRNIFKYDRDGNCLRHYSKVGVGCLFDKGEWALISNKNTQVEVPKKPIQTNSFKIGDRVRFLGTDFDEDYGTIKDIDLEESLVYFDDDTEEWYSNDRLELVLEEKTIENMDNNLDELDKAYEMEERLHSISEKFKPSVRSSSVNYDNEFPRKKVKTYINQDPSLNVLVSKKRGY